MAAITFNDFTVKKLSYIQNDNFNYEVCEINVSNEVNADIVVNEKASLATVALKAKVGSIEKSDVPFLVEVEIQGDFSYNEDEDDENTGFSEFLQSNAIAMLFPYLRSLISDMTSRSNQFPTYIMPPINIVKMLKAKSAISIKNEDK